MNILQAKNEIKKTIEIYLEKDEYGDYKIPVMKQRPVFMIGAPGIGKTAIVEQIAKEMGIALVAYSMTHHTRQSAIGLPFITEHQYGGEKVRVSQYTMSEIIASAFDAIEQTGRENGILFLDEINCVSETLAPAILQFLQYKTFGNRELPKGWIVVSAGNPPQYNRSVREFDIATRDRLKCLNIVEDFDVWKKYAYDAQVHGAIIAFLEVNKNWFYSVRMTPDGSSFATARGWEDLSFAIKMYELKGFDVDIILVQQYITDEDIARKFTVFYDLYRKYREDYQIEAILNNKCSAEVMQRAEKAPFDERIALMELLYETLNSDIVSVLEEHKFLSVLAKELREVKKEESKKECELSDLVEAKADCLRRTMTNDVRVQSKSDNDVMQKTIRMLEYYSETLSKNRSDDFDMIKKAFDKKAGEHAKAMETVGDEFESVIAFIENAWKSGRELSYYITVLTTGKHSSEFIALNGSDGYYRNNTSLLAYDVREKLKNEILMLDTSI